MKTVLNIKKLSHNLCLIASLVCSMSVFAVQDITAPQNAAAFTSATRYDDYGRPAGTIAPDPDGAGSLHHLATRTSYNDDGLVSKVESGELSDWPDQYTLPEKWSGFTVVSSKTFEYDSDGRKIAETTIAKNGDVVALTEYNYGSRSNIKCKAVRMSLTSGDACTNLSGDDRVTRYTYNDFDQVLTEERGVGSPVAQTYVTNVYQGKLLVSQKDANDNVTELRYDSEYKRLQKRIYPYVPKPNAPPAPTHLSCNQIAPGAWEAKWDPVIGATYYKYSTYGTSTGSVTLAVNNTTTQGACDWVEACNASACSDTAKFDGSLTTPLINESDYNEYTYDNNGNVKTERKRNGAVITYQYDANNRKTQKIMPNTLESVNYVYDLRGLVLNSTFNTGNGITNSFDGFGNLASTTNDMNPSASRSLSYDYDENGNRQSITHPDNVAFNYGFDGMNRAISLKNTSGASLVALTYGQDGRRSSLQYGDSSNSAMPKSRYNYSDGLHLISQELDLKEPATGTNDLTTSFLYNKANQVSEFTCSNSLYCYQGNANRTGTYVPDALNRYSKIAGQPMGYDSNSNMTNDGTSIYSYDDENRMLSASKRNAKFRYDPLGRLFETTIDNNLGAKITTQFLYDGDALVAEYDVSNGGNTHARRYLHGDQVDEPWVEYNIDMSKPWYLHANYQGSIVAKTDRYGLISSTQSYDSYGIPNSYLSNAGGNISRFGYTGQIVFPELGLNYYKARVYSPTIGRFLQTDPIGYKDDMDLYAYVGNDPLNRTDPTGTCGPFTTVCVAAIAAAARVAIKVVAEKIVARQVAKAAAKEVAKKEAATVEKAATKETITRKSPGGDGAKSEQTIKREDGQVTSRTHTVTKDGEVVHQHENHIGKSGGERQFPDEWTGTKTIGDPPYENHSPTFGPNQ